MKRTRRLLVIASESRYGRSILTGIHTYCRDHGVWEFHLESDSGADALERCRFAIERWNADGIIAQLRERWAQRVVAGSGLPVVNFSAFRRPGIPSVNADNQAVGRMVARHFLENGSRHFAFCARTSEPSRMDRCKGFADELRRAGHACHIYSEQYTPEHKIRFMKTRDRLEQWINSLPKPVAILCSHDQRGQQVSWACRHAGLRVPDDVALVAVGDDEMICRMSAPPISSVDVNAERIGYEAARILDRMLSGGRAPTKPVLIPPRRLVARQSSDIIAIDDREVAAAVRFIRNSADEPISVTDLLQEVPISRRALERRFEAALGRSPKAEIMRTRITRARQLLERPDLSIAVISERCGFLGQDRFCVAFRRECGMTPTQYRQSVLGGIA